MSRALAALLLLLSVAAAQESTPVALNRLTSSGVTEGEAYSLTNSLRSELGKTGKFSVMERSQMEEVLKEQGFQQSGACSDASCAVELGQVLSVKYMVLGHVGRVGKTYTLNVRLVDVATGKISLDVTEYHKGSIDKLLTNVVPIVAQKLAGTYKAEKKRSGLIIGLTTGVVAAVAVPVIIIAASGDDTPSPSSQTTDLDVRWLE